MTFASLLVRNTRCRHGSSNSLVPDSDSRPAATLHFLWYALAFDHCFDIDCRLVVLVSGVRSRLEASGLRRQKTSPGASVDCCSCILLASFSAYSDSTLFVAAVHCLLLTAHGSGVTAGLRNQRNGLRSARNSPAAIRRQRGWRTRSGRFGCQRTVTCPRCQARTRL